jgi:fibro-slime domain-containing protein
LFSCLADSTSKLVSDGSGGAAGNSSAAADSSSATGGDDGFAASSSSGNPIDECDNVLEVTYRDFTEAHPDFEMPFSGDVVRLQLVEATLGADKRPVFRDSIGCPPDSNDPSTCANWTPTQAVIASAATFNEWFHTIDGVNLGFDKTITLTEDPPGSETYVFDSSSFFPLADNEGFGPSPTNNNPNGKNFLFTTEIHVNFTYVAGQVFSFRGDDDLWIFVNDRLALDLGSMHLPADGVIDFDAQAAALGITPGGTYAMDIFQAERHTSGSNFHFETNISCFTPVDVPK